MKLQLLQVISNTFMNSSLLEVGILIFKRRTFNVPRLPPPPPTPSGSYTHDGEISTWHDDLYHRCRHSEKMYLNKSTYLHRMYPWWGKFSGSTCRLIFEKDVHMARYYVENISSLSALGGLRTKRTFQTELPISENPPWPTFIPNCNILYAQFEINWSNTEKGETVWVNVIEFINTVCFLRKRIDKVILLSVSLHIPLRPMVTYDRLDTNR